MRTDVKITDEMIESIKNDLKEKEQRESEILSKGYIDWLVDYISKSDNHSLSDEDFLYQEPSEDRDRSMELSWLFSALIKKGIKAVSSYSYGFEGHAVWFTYKGLMYKLETIYGQGSVTMASLYDDNAENEDKEERVKAEIFEISDYFNS